MTVTDPRHGTTVGYAVDKCRCDRCRAAIAEYQRTRPRPILTPGDPRHGTANGYGNLGCRCQPCRDANAVYNRPYRTAYNRRQGRVPRADYDQAHQAECGTRGGYNRHRRIRETPCDACRAAEAADRRARRRGLTRDEWIAKKEAEGHGTHAGYNRHRRRGEEACRACKDAEAACRRDRKARLLEVA
jgi:hypothetical protein